MNLRCDFHIHSCLSPCGLLEMSPAAIVRRAKETGLDAIALTDHNSARNTPAFARLCRDAGLLALYGLEVTVAEEAHVLCLFDRLEAAMDFGGWVYERLPDIPCFPDKMGDQVVVNEREEIEENVGKYLGSALPHPLSELLEIVFARGGLFIPSHIDRRTCSLSSQLGRVPELPYSAVEISPFYDLKKDPLAVRNRYALLASSDAHMLGQIGRRWTDLEVDTFDVPGLRAALERSRPAGVPGTGPLKPPARL